MRPFFNVQVGFLINIFFVKIEYIFVFRIKNERLPRLKLRKIKSRNGKFFDFPLAPWRYLKKFFPHSDPTKKRLRRRLTSVPRKDDSPVDFYRDESPFCRNVRLVYLQSDFLSGSIYSTIQGPPILLSFNHSVQSRNGYLVGRS